MQQAPPVSRGRLLHYFLYTVLTISISKSMRQATGHYFKSSITFLSNFIPRLISSGSR